MVGFHDEIVRRRFRVVEDTGKFLVADIFFSP
jgi:hypothetical protein